MTESKILVKSVARSNKGCCAASQRSPAQLYKLSLLIRENRRSPPDMFKIDLFFLHPNLEDWSHSRKTWVYVRSITHSTMYQKAPFC